MMWKILTTHIKEEMTHLYAVDYFQKKRKDATREQGQVTYFIHRLAYHQGDQNEVKKCSYGRD